MAKSWYNVKVNNLKSEAPTADVSIYDEIGGWGISARQFQSDFNAIPKDAEITVAINSPGGDVFDGVAIYNIIAQRRANVETRIDGLAASMASVIALAGRSTRMAENAFMMIHNPWGVTVGDAADMIKMGETLEKLKGGLVTSYHRKTGKSDEEISAAMDAETWFSAAEAKEWGLVDVIDEPIAVAALQRSLNVDRMSKFRNLPTDRIRRAVDSRTNEQTAMMRLITELKDLLGMKTKAAVKNQEPNPDESREEFMTRCQAEPGMSEESCAVKWEETSSPPADPDASQAQAGPPSTIDPVKTTDLLAAITGFREGVQADIAAMKQEAFDHRAAIEERMSKVDTYVEQRATAQTRQALAAQGIRGTVPQSNGDQAEGVIEEWQKLTGAKKTQFYRQHKAAIQEAVSA